MKKNERSTPSIEQYTIQVLFMAACIHLPLEILAILRSAKFIATSDVTRY